MNPGKTQLVCFRRDNKNQRKLKLSFMGIQIKESKSITVLGVTLGKTSLLMEHSKARAKIANQRTALIKRLRGYKWGASIETLLKIYKQFIRPILEYGSIIYSKNYKHSLKHLELAERRAIRTALKVGMRTPIRELYARSNIQPISERIKYLRMKALARFDSNNKGMQDLTALKQIMGVSVCDTSEKDSWDNTESE